MTPIGVQPVVVRKALRVVVIALGALLAMGLVAAPASAIKVHVFDFSFGEKGSGSGQLNKPAGIAVNEETNNVYVVDQANARIQEFSESGTPLGSFTGAAAPTGPLKNPKDVAIDNSHNPLDSSENDLYVSGEAESGGKAIHVVYKFSEGGTYLGQIASGSAGSPLGELLGVAVDTTGQLWVYQESALKNGNGEVIHYTSALSNELVGACEDARGPGAGLAVDSEENLYVNTGNRRFAKLSSACEERIFEVDGEPQVSVAAAIDTETNQVYLDNITSAARFSPAAELIERFGEGDITEGAGIAVNSASSEKLVYVADRGANAVRAFREVIRPTVSTLPATSLGPNKATLNGTVNPEGVEVSSCVFQYGESSAYGQSVPCEPDPGEGEAPVAVSAKPAGLQPGKTYHFRLVASNENGQSEGEDQSFTLGPGIDGQGVSEVSADAATLNASINPHDAPTSAFFQYGTSAAYGTNVPGSPLALGEGEGDVEVAPQRVQGLSPNTTYHFRVVAIQEGEQFPGQDQTFTTQGAGGALTLPDGRAWELVSPPNKQGALIEGIGLTGVEQAAASGNAVSYLANAPTEASPQGGTGLVQVLSARGPEGWGSRNIASPHTRATGQGFAPPEYQAFAEDLSAGVIQPWGLFEAGLSGEASEQTPYLRALGGCESGCYRPLVSATNALAGFGEERICEEENGIGPNAEVICGPGFVGASPDLEHVALISPAPLFAGAGREQLYEWSDGALAQVSLLPKNEAGEELPAPDGTAGLGVGFVRLGGETPSSARHAISADGTRVFWEAQGTLYVRDLARGQTLQVDTAEAACAEEGECESGGGRFQIASANGASVLFTDTRRLRKDAGQAGLTDLYECKLVVEGAGGLACQLSDLTPESGGESARVQKSVLGASEDDSTVYFVAEGALDTAPNTRGQAPIAGQANLYVSRGGALGFIATLAPGDRHDWVGRDQERSARVSPSGKWLAFMSERPLSGYDNRDALSAKPDAEVYEYEADTGSLRCASCDPSGARPRGMEYGRLGGLTEESLVGRQANWEGSGWVAALMPANPAFESGESIYQTRALFDSGRLFFNALDALVPQDANGNWDVYQREPAGVGKCEAGAPGFESAGASCLGLISSGESAQQSAFLDASKSGGDVFFLTSAPLTKKDIDQSRDVYDAHECTSASPCSAEEVVQSPPCSTEASCKLAPTPQPQIFGAPASSTFSGSGNAPPPPPTAKKVVKKTIKCAKGKKLSRGRCVKGKAKRKTNRKRRK